MSRISIGLLLLASSQQALAQLAPTGGHYGGRASDTGHEGGTVNASGSYSASVPLDLPGVRGGLPVPLQIRTSGGFGAAGLGWDVPLSYVRRDTSFARRRPQFGSDIAPKPRVQVSLSLGGQTMELVPKGTDWVPRTDAPELKLREQSNTWVLFDGQGLTYTFTAPAALNGAGLWLLTSVTGPRGARVQLDYQVGTPALPGGAGISIDLARVLYNWHPNTGCPKHEVALEYGSAAAAPLSLSMLGDKVIARMRTITAVDVLSRATCGGGLQRLRRYALTYLPDADTQQPRLRSVQMLGRQGTAEQNIAVPVASYGYGTATNAGKLRYQKTQAITLPPEADSAKISSTDFDVSVVAPTGGNIGYATWQTLTDVTGDGRPDLVFPKNGKLWVARNRPTSAGSTVLNEVVSTGQLQDSTFLAGALETRGATNNRFNYSASNRNIDKVWRQAIDVNGDGRVDVIDAAETAGQWIIYLNTPGPGASGIKWEKRAYAITRLYNHLWLRGHDVQNNFLPLASRFTGRDRTVGACWIYNGTAWVSYQAGWTNGACGSAFPNALLSTGPEATYTEWEVKDINGDGYPDVVFNSSRVDMWSMGGPKWTGQTNETANTQLLFKVQPKDGASNKINAVFHLRGMLTDSPITSINPFSAPVDLKTNALCGVRLWAESFGIQEVVCGIDDVNGDGLVDRIENRRDVLLGTGSGFSTVKLNLPGSMSTQVSPQIDACKPPASGSATFGVGQSTGLRDLTGDGIPDYFNRSGSTSQVAIGTGTGFAPPIAIDVVGSGFSYSGSTERCDGKTSSTGGGLYDIDGDGKPEVVFATGAGLDVYQLAGGAVPRTPEAGRLVEVSNGFGAKTTVAYRSAKEDPSTRHQVPFPEIVATQVETTGTLGLGGTLSGTRYAYGNAEQIYDSSRDAFTFPAYGRSVALRIISSDQGRTEATAAITDTYPLAAFAPTPKNERFGRYLKAGRIRDVTTLSGSIGADPWALLAINLSTDPRRIGSTHYDWATRLMEEPAIAGTNILDCMELMFPYDFAASWGQNSGWYDTCSAHGFVYGVATENWRGAAPPSTANVATRSEVRGVDDFGRVTDQLLEKDRYKSDDDVCVETKYAAPSGANERVLSAPSSRRVWGCNSKTGVFPTYGAESWSYDNLPAGSVSSGLVTSHLVDRRSTDDGALLKTIRDFDASYDVAGNLSVLARVREDGAVRTTTLDYDPFGLVSVRTRITASAAPVLESSTAVDPISLEALSSTDPNLTVRGTELDGFGRVLRSTVTPPGGPVGVLSTMTYLGFTGGDPLGRRIVSKTFSDPVPPAAVSSAIGRTTIGFLDELGRTRRTEHSLGTDYANETLVGARSYDGLGRVAFEADPYPLSQSGSTAYGTTYLFRTDGFPSCFIQGKGPQLLTSATDEVNERYPSCFFRSFANHEETLGVSDAAAQLGTAPQSGVIRYATLTGTGRVLSRSTWQNGVRLEHSTFSHNQVGQLTAMARYLDPANGLNPVQTSWRFDSFGQVLQWQDPEGAPQFTKHSDFGELLEVRWTDATTAPVIDHRMLSSYDALGRVTHREERNNGVTDPETVNDYLYDVGTMVTPEVKPTYLLGRLARAKAPSGEVAFSFDAFGQVNARTFSSYQGDTYVEVSRQRADGALAALELYLPDTGFKQERVDYGYDSAARLRSMKFSDGSSSKILFQADDIDPFGRVRKAKYGETVDYSASYASLGRRLINEVTVSSAYGSRRLIYLGFDPVGREKSRREIKDGALTGPKTNLGYDALGRLVMSLQTDGALTLSNRQFSYDALGNVLGLADLLGATDATLSYRPVDRDRACRVGYGNGGLGGTSCNFFHDAVGNVVEQATRTGVRRMSYFGSGNIRRITEQSAQADFRYDAFGSVQELDLNGAGTTDARKDRRYGGLIEVRDETVAGTTKSFISRQFPGPGGIAASRRGTGKDWVFHFGEQRGSRFFTDANGAFIQEVEYQPFGEPKSTGVGAGSAQYTRSQWNGGDSLAAFGLSHLGARLYDPVIGRFLSRDPLVIPRTAATTNPYAFAINDPVNLSDPTGRDFGGCIGKECQGPIADLFTFGGVDINPPGLYFPSAGQQPSANPQPVFRPPTPTPFSKGPQTVAGKALKEEVEDRIDFTMGDGFNFDTLAATGMSIDAVMERIEQTPDAHAAVDRYNARLDSAGSFFAGMGDAMWFWCPGCASNARQTWGITSGDADPWAYGVGSFTGIIGGLATPRVTSVIAEPPVPTSTPPGGSIRGVNPTKGNTNCANCAIATDNTLAGRASSAMPGGPTHAWEVAAFYGKSWIPANGTKGIATILTNWGSGSRGIVWGTRGAAQGHYFNAVNQGGVIRFLDGQTGGPAVLTGYDGFYLLRTN